MDQIVSSLIMVVFVIAIVAILIFAPLGIFLIKKGNKTDSHIKLILGIIFSMIAAIALIVIVALFSM